MVNKSQPNLSNVVNMECLNQYSSVPRNTNKVFVILQTLRIIIRNHPYKLIGTDELVF